MKSLFKYAVLGFFMVGLIGCSDKADDTSRSATEKAAASSSASAGECKLESTKSGNAPLLIKATDKDTPEAKEFLATCINPYTKKYVADAEAAKEGKKKFGYWSCTQCHGGNAGGQTGPSIIDERWQYAKHTTDKGLFETIAGGTDMGMMAWHQQVTGNAEMLPTDDILKIIGWLRASYTGTGDKPWLE